MTEVNHFIIAFTAFFAIMNPVSSLPIYLTLTEYEDKETAHIIARKGLLTAFSIIVVVSLAGKFIFDLFGMTMPALRLAGGIIVFLIGLEMLQGQNSNVNTPVNPEGAARAVRDRDDVLGVAISPLAMPMLAGPGTIATTMNLSAYNTFIHALLTIAAYAVMCIITYVLFLSGKSIIRFLGKSAMRVMTRMMGLILAVIGTQMVINGIYDAFPMLNGLL